MSINNGKKTDVVLFDFAMAFDKVPHQQLLHKLKGYGVDNKTGKKETKREQSLAQNISALDYTL